MMLFRPFIADAENDDSSVIGAGITLYKLFIGLSGFYENFSLLNF